MNWSAERLQPGYQRCIIGFDLRIKKNKKEFTASVDKQVWPETNLKNKIIAQCNGFNFFDMIDDDIKCASETEDSLLTAFDMPECLGELLLSTFGLKLIPFESIFSDRNWQLMGFDVVDFPTQCSVLYSFDWSESEKVDLLRKLSVRLNTFGLVQNELDAIIASYVSDEVVPEHSPFSPCGVWGYWKS